MDTTPQKPSEDGQPGSLRSGDLFGVLSQVLHDAENGKTGARLADYAPHIRELMADKARLDWLEKREPDAALWDYVADAINIRAAIDAAMKEVQP